MAIKILLILLALGVLFLVFDWYEVFIFQPKKLDNRHVFNFKTPYQELFLNSKDGAAINAIHFCSDNPKGIILYFHGNKDNLERWGKITETLTKYQYDVFVMDYRGYGKSTGKRSESAFYEDAKLCYDYIKQYFDHDKIIVFGRSLGSGIASWVAAEKPVKALILETPYYSFDDLAQSYLPFSHYFLNYHFNNYQNVQKVECPILIFHGTNDNITSYDSALKLYKSIQQKDINFITLPEGTHHNLATFSAYQDTLSQFLAR